MRLTPRTTLFVPGDRPSRIANALSCGAESVTVDLEDAVAESVKDEARQTAVHALGELDTSAVPCLVRVNGMTTDHVTRDVAALAPLLGRLAAIILPMTESAEDVRGLSELLTRAEREAGLEEGHVRIVATIETASGVLSAREVAASSARIVTLLFGSADLSNELGLDPTSQGSELATARSTVVLAAGAARVQRPLDGPYLTLDDDTGLEQSSVVARRLGFGGKATIHPAQIPTVTRVFAPTAEQLAWASRVDEAFTAAETAGRSAVRLDDGSFIDYPVVRRARALLAQDDKTGGSR